MSASGYVCAICGRISQGGHLAFAGCLTTCPNHPDAKLFALQRRVDALDAGGKVEPLCTCGHPKDAHRWKDGYRHGRRVLFRPCVATVLMPMASYPCACEDFRAVSTP